MNVTWVGRMAAFFTMLLLGSAPVLWSSQSPVHASSITLKWADQFDDKPFCSSSPERTNSLKKNWRGTASRSMRTKWWKRECLNTAAIVSVEGFDELAIGVNLFNCSEPCDFRITFAALEARHSRSVSKICQTNPKPLDSQYKKYFFCRDVFHRNSAANDRCWPETLSALTGWFEAAYKLHELTLRDGIGFVARDLEIERLIHESLAKAARSSRRRSSATPVISRA